MLTNKQFTREQAEEFHATPLKEQEHWLFEKLTPYYQELALWEEARDLNQKARKGCQSRVRAAVNSFI